MTYVKYVKIVLVYEDFRRGCRSVIHGVMQEVGYSEDQIGQYFKMLGDTTVTKTHGQKIGWWH